MTRWGERLQEWLELWDNPDIIFHKHEPIRVDLQPGTGKTASISLVRSSDQFTSEREWVLAEAWWAEAFAAPGPRRMASWTLQAFPQAIIGYAVGRFARLRGAMRYQSQPATGLARLISGARMAFWIALVIPATVVLGPILAILAAFMLVVGLVPISSVRRAIAAIQIRFTSVLGDSQIFLESEFRSAYMAQAVDDGLDLLRERRCRRIAVVAHSQGAAIARLALERTTTPKRNIDLLVTIGSGINKLDQLKRFPISVAFSLSIVLMLAVTGASAWYDLSQQIPSVADLVLSTGPIIAAVVASPFYVFVVESRVKRWGKTVPITLSVISGAALVGWVTLVGVPRPAIFIAFMSALSIVAFGAIYAEGTKQARVRPNDRFFSSVGQWLDLWALQDPIPNGPTRIQTDPTTRRALLGRSPDDWHRSIQVRNFDSLLFDHTTYWDARDDAVTHVGIALLNLSDRGALHETRHMQQHRVELALMEEMFESARMDRAWRLGWLRSLRLLSIVFAALIGVRVWPWSPRLTDASKGAPEWLGLERFSTLTSYGESALASFALVTLGSWFALLALFRAIWSYWNKTAELNYLGRLDRRESMAPPLGLTYCLAVGVVTISRFWILPPSLTWHLGELATLLLQTSLQALLLLILFMLPIYRQSFAWIYRAATGGNSTNDNWYLPIMRGKAEAAIRGPERSTTATEAD